MGHHINAVILKGTYDSAVAVQYDLGGISLTESLTLFFITPYYQAYWQHILLGAPVFLPAHDKPVWIEYYTVLSELMRRITRTTEPVFAVIQTDYHGGMGEQHAHVYINERLADQAITQISPALKYLGVVAKPKMDEFDTVGLSMYRSSPEYLEKYGDLCEELGI